MSKLQIPADSPAVEEAQAKLEQSNPLPPIAPLSFPTDSAVIFDAKKKREERMGLDSTFSLSKDGVRVGGYLGAMWRQDGFVDGLMAQTAGNASLLPDPDYSPYAPAEWTELTSGIPEEYHREFYKAHSKEHGVFIKSRIQDKLHDLANLGDLGVAGNIGRLAFGLVEPTNLAAAVMSGPVTAAVRGLQSVRGSANAVRQANKIENAAERAAALQTATGALESAAAREGTATAFASGVGAAGVAGAGFEWLRQSVNFENDPGQILEAALFTMGLSAPFAGLSSREMNRLTRIAGEDRQALHVSRKALSGEELTPNEVNILKQAEERLEHVQKIESGQLRAEDVEPSDLRIYSETDADFPARSATAATKRDARRAENEAGKRPAESENAEGVEVFWNASGSGLDGGTVVGVNHKGALKVALYPSEQAAPFRPVSGPRHKWISREDLDSDSPLYRSAAAPDGFLPGSVGAAQVGRINNTPDQGSTAFAKARLDVFATLNKSENENIRRLGALLVKDPIQTDAHIAQGWTASESKRHAQRTIGGMFHRDTRDAFNEAARVRGLSLAKQVKFHEEFYANVSRVARGDAFVAAANPDIAPQLQKAAVAQRKLFDVMADRAKAAGVQGAENLKTEGTYVNRIWNHNNIRSAIKKHGENNVTRLVANAIRVQGLTGDVEKARAFLSAVRKLEFDHVLPDLQLLGRDMAALRAELGDLKSPGNLPRLTQAETDALIDVMFAAAKREPDAGNAGNMRFRFDLDENHRETFNGQTLRLSDLLENDSRILVDRYMNSMAGHIAMAERGYKSRAEFMRELAKADDEHAAGAALTGDASKFNREKQLVLDMYDHITGRPMSTQSFNRLDRAVGAFRAYTRSVFLGQLGVAAAFEMSNAIGLGTVRAFYQQMPTFRGAIRALKTGRLPNAELAGDIEAMTGFGLERAAGYARQHEITEFTYDRGLTHFEDATNKAAHAVDIISGNAYFTSATRQATASIMVQKHVNMATGSMELTPKLRERLVGQGLDDDAIEPVLAALNRHTKKDSKGAVEEIEWERWQQADPATYDAYQLALTREVRDGIQDHDIGETMPWMHTTLGKIIAELRTFTFVAHAKQNLKNAHYMDQQALITFNLTFMSQAMAYAMQTAANFAHNPEELEKRLSLERIAKAAVQRMSITGIAPMLFETGYTFGTGQSFFQGGTANTDNRNLLVTPSLTAARRLLGAGNTLGNAMNPFADTTTTQREARDLFSALPGGNWFLMRNLNDAISSTFPKNDPREE